jgi:hypothetical protein
MNFKFTMQHNEACIVDYIMTMERCYDNNNFKVHCNGARLDGLFGRTWALRLMSGIG